MPADLTVKDDKVLFVANRSNGHPWHRLGHEVSTNLTLEQALELTQSDDYVMPVTLYAQTDDNMIEVTDTIGMFSDKHGLIATGMSPGYVPKQRREIAELAYTITGLDKDGAYIDTMGNIGPNANQFFTYIKVPELVIDPHGIADTVERGIVGATSFDGSLKNLLFYSDIRVVCSNTLSLAMRLGLRMIAVKHTKNSEDKILQAAKALEYLGARELEIIAKAEAMLKVDGDKAMDRILDNLWPIEDVEDRTKTRRLAERGNVRYLYEGDNNLNVELVGRNGWAAYNATVEYLDHFRPVKGTGKDKKRAESAVMPGGTVDTKMKVGELVLA